MSEGEYWKDEILCANAGLESDNTWVTSEGEYIDIDDLTDGHLINIVKKIKSNGAEKDFNQYDNLVKELRSRKLDMTRHPSNKLEPLIGRACDMIFVDRREYDEFTGFRKDDIESAVKFCRRYIHNWDLLNKERPEIAKMCEHLEYDEEYNKWLIDYSFSDVTYGRT